MYKEKGYYRWRLAVRTSSGVNKVRTYLARKQLCMSAHRRKFAATFYAMYISQTKLDLLTVWHTVPNSERKNKRVRLKKAGRQQGKNFYHPLPQTHPQPQVKVAENDFLD